MVANSQRNLRFRKLLFSLLLVVICISVIVALYENREWKVPDEAKLRKNPFRPSRAALVAARPIYLDKCAQCHGDTGKGDGPEAALYYPTPKSLIDTHHMNTVTDGELFYQITEGRKPMPAFKNRLTEEQRWQLVLYVRSLAPQPNESQ